MKRFIILFCFFIIKGEAATCQTKKADTSINAQLIEYLKSAQKLVIYKKESGVKKYNQIQALLSVGYDLDKKLAVQQNEFKTRHIDFLKEQFRWIIQSIIIYKSDLKLSNYRLPRNNSEIKYLSKKIPELLNYLEK
ncbi:MAG: hypothetical protein FGM46_05060 [Ferruginibacter sp.]|nr:hypothetical protein [Ferruginibacter sp.]